jgi:hypothetical protein
MSPRVAFGLWYPSSCLRVPADCNDHVVSVTINTFEGRAARDERLRTFPCRCRDSVSFSSFSCR